MSIITTIKANRKYTGEQVEVPAVLPFEGAPWAVSCQIDRCLEDDMWTITHIKTGSQFNGAPYMETFYQRLLLAERLSRELPMDDVVFVNGEVHGITEEHRDAVRRIRQEEGML